MIEVIEEVLGEYDPTMWRIFSYDENGEYMEFTDIESMKKGKFVPGVGYWFISRNPLDLSLTGTQVHSDQEAVLVLHPGWNQIGCPLTVSVDWSLVEVDASYLAVV